MCRCGAVGAVQLLRANLLCALCAGARPDKVCSRLQRLCVYCCMRTRHQYVQVFITRSCLETHASGVFLLSSDRGSPRGGTMWRAAKAARRSFEAVIPGLDPQRVLEVVMPVVNAGVLAPTYQACTRAERLALVGAMYNSMVSEVISTPPVEFVEGVMLRVGEERAALHGAALHGEDDSMSESDSDADISGPAPDNSTVTSATEARHTHVWPAEMTMRDIVAEMGDITLDIESIVDY